jgi:hypothetical protein
MIVQCNHFTPAYLGCAGMVLVGMVLVGMVLVSWWVWCTVVFYYSNTTLQYSRTSTVQYSSTLQYSTASNTVLHCQ